MKNKDIELMEGAATSAEQFAMACRDFGKSKATYKTVGKALADLSVYIITIDDVELVNLDIVEKKYGSYMKTKQKEILDKYNEE